MVDSKSKWQEISQVGIHDLSSFVRKNFSSRTFQFHELRDRLFLYRHIPQKLRRLRRLFPRVDEHKCLAWSRTFS